MKTNSKPPYWVGFFGLIPLIGFIVGLIILILGIVKYKSKKFIGIGIGAMLFTVIIYSTLFYVGFKSDFGKKGWEKHAQMQLNTLVKHIEYYKLTNGEYPDSLQQIENGKEFIFLTDPTQTTQRRKNIYYNYSNLGKQYLLFSSGSDGIPNTSDDIHPQIANKNTGWKKK